MAAYDVSSTPRVVTYTIGVSPSNQRATFSRHHGCQSTTSSIQTTASSSVSNGLFGSTSSAEHRRATCTSFSSYPNVCAVAYEQAGLGRFTLLLLFSSSPVLLF